MGEQRRPRRRRDGPHPPDPAGRRAGAGGLPRTTVAREHLPAVLLAPSPAERRRPRALHDRRHGRPGRPRRRALRGVHRLGQLRALGRARRRRRGVHGGRRAPGQGHRHAAPRAPRGDRPRQRRHPLHRRGPRRQPPMLAVFSRAGWPVERRFESGVVDLDFPLDETEEFLDSVERREQRADSRAVARLLLPRTIAVVGASDTRGLGRQGAVAPRHRRSHRRRVPGQPAARHGRWTPRLADAAARSRPTCRSPSSPSPPPRCPP